MDKIIPIETGSNTFLNVNQSTDQEGNVVFKTSSGQQFNVQQLVDYVSAAWGANASDQLDAKVKEMEQKNQQLQEANTILTDIRNHVPSTSSGTAVMDAKTIAWMKDNDITPISTGSMNQAQWNQEVQVVSEKINTMNSTSQIETIKLDQLNKNHAQIFEFMSNTNQLFSKTMLSIINNMQG